MSVRILYLSEIMGRAGLFSFKKLIPALKEEFEPDLVLVNGNGTTGGSGVGKAHALYLRKLSGGLVLTGEGAFYKKDIVELFPKASWLLRPYNYPAAVPGRGIKICETPKGRIAVVSLLGQAGYARVHLESPFKVFDDILPELKAQADWIVVEFRAPTTAEKCAFWRHADGSAAAIVGTGARTLTADATVSPAGTAFICDAGMCGSSQSVVGMDPDTKVKEYRTGIPLWARDAVEAPEVQGCILELGESGKACDIIPLRRACKETFHE